MTFCAFVLETLTIVNDQVERRTYGAHSVRGTIQAWENLARQTRLLLLLRSRAGTALLPSSSSSSSGSGNNGGTVGGTDEVGYDPFLTRRKTEFTVCNLSTGQISLHRLLAADTLGFAVRAEQALEHEDKCRDVYAKSMQSRRMQSHMSMLGPPGSSVGSVIPGTSPDTHSAAAGGTVGKTEVLLAWGPVADKRWKDLLAVAVAEDAIQAALQSEVLTVSSSSSGGGGGPAAQSASTVHATLPPPPSLVSSLLSPLSPSAAAAVGAVGPGQGSTTSTAEQQARHAEEQKRTLKRRRPLLLYFPMHSQPHLLGAYRTIILAERYEYVNPCFIYCI